MEITDEELKKKIDEAVAEKTKGLFTQEQVNKAISTRINEEKEKHKKDIEERERVAKMTAEEKQKHDLEIISQERDEYKKQLAEKEHKEKILTLMSDKKIDSGFFELFAGVSDYEKACAAMDKFNDTIKSNVDKAVEGKLKPNIPSSDKHNNDTNNPNAAINQSIRAALGYSN